MKRRKASAGKLDKAALTVQKQEVQSEEKRPQKGVEKEIRADIISKHYKMVIAVAGAVVSTYSIINYIFNMLYQRECEKFYRIPGKYFKETADERLLYVGIILALVIMCLIPSFLRKYTEKRGGFSKKTFVGLCAYSLYLGLAMGSINIYNLIQILEKKSNTVNIFEYLNAYLDQHDSVAIITAVFVVGMSCISVVGILCFNDICKIKVKWKRAVLSSTFSISFVVCFLLLFNGTISKVSIDVKDKVDYEFFKSKGIEYIVLSEYEDKLLVVNYKEKYPNTLFTDNYMLLDKCDGTYSYVIMKQAPKVEK